MLQGTAVGGLRTFFRGMETLGARSGTTALILAGIAAFGWVVVPRLAEGAEGPDVKWAVSGALGRAIQFELLVLGAISLLYVWGKGFYVDNVDVYLEDHLIIAGRVFGSLLVAFSAYAGSRVLSDAVGNLGGQTDWMTDHQEEIVLRTSQLLLFGFAGLMILSLWEANLGGLLVGAGFLGIVVGLAARQTLGSLIAGFVLMFSRPFTIGDWIQVGDREGIVTDITIFHTRLENFDGEFVVIPNDRVSERPITNRSRKGLLRISIDVGIDYNADPEHAKEVVVDAISDLSEVIDAPPPRAFPKSFGDSAVVLEVRFWIDHPTPPRKWNAVSAVVSTVKSTFEAEGIKIPYPQQELSGRTETGGFRVHTGGATEAETADPPEADGTD